MRHLCWLFIGVLLALVACTQNEDANQRIDASQNGTECRLVVDTARHWILYNGPSAGFDSINGSSARICSDSLCIGVWGDGGVLRRAGEPYEGRVDGTDTSAWWLFWTQLPLIELTVGDSLQADFRVPGHFKLLENGALMVEDSMGIELHGASSLATFAKKSMRVELLNGSGEDKQSLLGMQKDGDWLLLSLYNEQMRVESASAAELWQSLGHPGPQQKHVEVFLNGSYMGVYGLMRKGDKKLIGVSDEGEIYKGIYWTETSTYRAQPLYDTASTIWEGFEAIYPEMPDWGRLALFLAFITQEDSSKVRCCYQQWFDESVLVDYFLYVNALRLVDNSGKNLFLYRNDTNSVYSWFPWDLDGGFGNYYDGSYNEVATGIIGSGIYDRLVGDSLFATKLRNRWQVLRAGPFAADSLLALLEKHRNVLQSSSVYSREKPIWENVSTDMAPYRTWINARLAYLDGILAEADLAAAYYRDYTSN